MTILLVLVVGSLLLAFSNYPQGDELQRIRSFSRPLEFDYVGWTVNALGTKLGQIALGAADNLPPEEQSQLVLDYLDLIRQIDEANHRLNEIYADPEIVNPQIASRLLRQQLQDLEAQRALLGPVAESILQDRSARSWPIWV